MQFKTVFAAFVVAATAVSAAPRPIASFNEGSEIVARAKKTASGENKFLATPFAGQSKVNIAAARQRAKAAAKNKGGKAGNAGSQNNNGGGAAAASSSAAAAAASSSAAAAAASSSAAAAAASSSAAAAAAGSSAAAAAASSSAAAAAASDSSAAAASASSSAAAAAATSTGTAEQDSGVAAVAEGCTSSDGSSGCFQFLNVLGSCFTIPLPLANDVQFFLGPPPVAGVASTCTLFSDEDCQANATPAQGAVSNIAQNSYICNATAAAA